MGLYGLYVAQQLKVPGDTHATIFVGVDVRNPNDTTRSTNDGGSYLTGLFFLVQSGVRLCAVVTINHSL
jgi:hypothetical protein